MTDPNPPIPSTMRAAVLSGHGGADMLQVHNDVAVPAPVADEVLIKVGACGMNNTDINTRVGWYSSSVTSATTSDDLGDAEDGTWGDSAMSFPRIQGADLSGQVVAVGSDVGPELLGRRVLVDPWIRSVEDPGDRSKAGYLGSERDGGFAEYCAVPAINVYPHDLVLSDRELAGFACSWSTAEHMLQRVRLSAGQQIVITGASGGVGSALVQLAKLRGAEVTAVCSSAKMPAVRELGADHVVARDEDPVGQAVAAAGPFDVVADVVGGSDFDGWLHALRRGGRFVTSGAIAGPIVELDLRTLYLNDLEFYGATVYEPSVFAALMVTITSGAVRPVVSAAFPLEQIHAAQEAFMAKQHVGALVIEL